MGDYPSWADTPEERKKLDGTNKKGTSWADQIRDGLKYVANFKQREKSMLEDISPDAPTPPTTTTTTPKADWGQPRTTIRNRKR